jgi:lipopolysaccharide export system protein LptA
MLSGDVQLEQPGRHGTGEMLLYTAATGRYVLTGTPAHPPRAVDAQQGTVTGTSLTFADSGSTIIVAGEPGTPKTKGTRVRTETEVRPEGKK